MSSNKHEARPCPACGSEVGKHLGEKCRFEILVCRSCSTLYTSHLPSQLESQDYDAYYDNSNLTVPEFIERRVSEIVAEFEGYRRNNRFLDIGFGAGTMMESAAKAGWNVFGQEVSGSAVTHAKQRGFDVFLGELHQAQFRDEYFDVVTASEIIEHVSEPEVLLREVRRILRPGGVFWATTPFAQSISFRLMGIDWSTLKPPDHLQLYSASGVLGMLRRAGFTTVELSTTGVNPIEIATHFRSRFKRKGADNDSGFDRVRTACSLNEQISSSRRGRLLKDLANGVLDFLKIGDSLKIMAER